jgi:gentisate 1,2-dioxygenase
MNPETSLLLEKLARVPHLLDLARKEAERSGEDRYTLQERLAAEHRARKEPFLLASPMRHPGSCAKGHRFGEVQYRLITQGRGLFGSREHTVQFSEGQLHDVREHGAPLPDELAKALQAL